MPDSPLPPPVPGWEGFQDPNYTPVPDDFFDVLLAHLTDVEVRVLLYIIRRTYGFKKTADDISLTQIVKGITTRDGRRLDYGAGVKRDGAIAAVKRLEARGILIVERGQGADGVHETNTYRLRKAGAGWSPPPTTVVGGTDYPGRPDRLPVVAPADSQETAQETDYKRGLDPDLLAAIRTFAGKRHQNVTPERVAALAEAAGTLARWQAASAGARSLAEVEAALENGR